MSRFAHGANIHQGTRQEGAQAVDVDGETTLDLAADLAGDGLVGFVGFFQFFPGFRAAGFFAGQARSAETVFHSLQRNLNFVAHLEVAFAVLVLELTDRNDAFGFETGMDGHPVLVDIDDNTGDNGAGRHFDGVQAFFKKFCKAFAHVGLPSKMPELVTLPPPCQMDGSVIKESRDALLAPTPRSSVT